MRCHVPAVRLTLCIGFAAGLAFAGCSSRAPEGGGDGPPPEQLKLGPGPGDVEAAKRQSINNLRQMALAMHNHHDAYQSFPTPGLARGAKAPPGFYPPHSWRVQILPFIEQQALFNQIPMGGVGPLPDALPKTVVKVYENPRGAEGYELTDTPYRVFVGNGAAFEFGQRIKMTDFTDGTSNTILIVEAAEPVNWAGTDELNYDPNRPLPRLGIFPGGFHAAMADGAVRWIPATTDQKTIRLMITRNDGVPFEMPGKRVDKDE